MRFEEAYGGWTERRLSQEEAAQLLGVCERTFRRYIDRYEEEGLDGLIDKRLSQVSHRRAPVDEVMRLVDRYRSRHEGWSVKHYYYAWYRREGAAQLQLGEEHLAGSQCGHQRAAPRGRSQATPTYALPGDYCSDVPSLGYSATTPLRCS